MPGIYAACQQPVQPGGRRTGVGSELTAPAVAGLAGKLDRVPELAGVQRTVTELPGGLTNHNYKVSTPEGAFVVRVWSGGGDFLAINRDHEYRNSVAAAQAGVGAAVVAYHPEDNLLVLRFIEGRTFGNSDVQLPANIPRIAQACRSEEHTSELQSHVNLVCRLLL